MRLPFQSLEALALLSRSRVFKRGKFAVKPIRLRGQVSFDRPFAFYFAYRIAPTRSLRLI
jgi:hypothetical protein